MAEADKSETKLASSTSRNPSPPPDYDVDNDPKTLYTSQSVLLNSLLLLLKENESVAKSTEKGEKVEDLVEELDPALEQKLCLMWDMSTDENIADLLLDNNCIDIFIQSIKLTNKPRLTEILVGIIGNLYSLRPAGEKMKDNTELFDVLMSMCACRDSGTLAEIMRCLKICIEFDYYSSEIWTAKFDEFRVWDDLIFILRFTANDRLLVIVLEFIDSLLLLGGGNSSYAKIVDCLCLQHGDIAEDFEHLFDEHQNNADIRRLLFSIIQSLSTYESSYGIFCAYSGLIIKIINQHALAVLENHIDSILKQQAASCFDNTEIFQDFDSSKLYFSILEWLRSNSNFNLDGLEETKEILRRIKDKLLAFQDDELKLRRNVKNLLLEQLAEFLCDN